MTSIILATSHRLPILKNSFKRFRDTTKHLLMEFVCIVDEDEETAQWLRENCLPHDIVVHNPVLRGSSAAWNQGLSLATHEMIFPAGDDAYAEDGWLDFALEAHSTKLNGYGMVGMNDTIFHGDALCTTPLYDRKFIKDVLGGVICVPHYLKYGVDNEAHERAVIAGRYVWEPRAIVRHEQHLIGPDDFLRKRFPHNHTDGVLLGERRAKGFPNDFEPVI